MLMAVAMFGTIMVPLLLGVPIAAALGLSGITWLYLIDPERLIYLKGAASAIWNTANNETLISVPLFVLMGEIIQRSGIGSRFYRSISSRMSGLPGGALHTNIAACTMISAVSGSSVATAATVGSAAVPNLKKLGYERKLIYGTLAAGGTLGSLIPPSIPLIIYAALVEESVGRLFMAALLPGMMVAILFSIYVLLHSLYMGSRHPDAEKALREDRLSIAQVAVEILPFALIFGTVIGFLYMGWATPAETAGVGVAIAMATAAAYRELNYKLVWDALVASTRLTAMIILVVIGASIFSYALFSWGVTRAVADWTTRLDTAPVIIFTCIVVMYLILGMFIDAISMMVLTLGTVFPVITQLGYDPVWFGVVLVLLLEIGLITPPVGLNLFTIQALDRTTTLGEVALGSFPFVVMLLVGVLLLTLFPAIALWLPSIAF